MCFVHVGNFSVLVETGFLIGSCMLPLELLSFGSFKDIIHAETCLSSLCSATAGLTALLVSMCIPRMRMKLSHAATPGLGSSFDCSDDAWLVILPWWSWRVEFAVQASRLPWLYWGRAVTSDCYSMVTDDIWLKLQKIICFNLLFSVLPPNKFFVL